MSDTNSTEVFRDVPGFPGYRVSNYGRLKSCLTRRRVVGIKGSVSAMSDEWHLMATKGYGRSGHVLCRLRRETVLFHVGLHRLVLMAFVGPCPEGMECRHLDGNAGNNRLENLCWGTRSDNHKDAIRHGTMPQMGCGEKHANAKLKDAEVIEIKRCLSDGERTGQLARRFKVSPSTICGIRTGRRWGHII